MPFSPHWIDTFANSINSIVGFGARSENIVRIGDVLYGVFMHYEYPGDTDGTLVTRKSTDSGVTWTDLGVAPAISNPFTVVSIRLTTFVRLGKLELFWAINDGTTNIQWQTYDPVSNTWASVVNTGLPYWWRSPQQYSSLFAGLRPDGAIIVAFPDLVTFDVRVSKWASGSWSTLGGFFDGSDFAILIQSGLIDDNGNAQMFMMRDVNSAGNNKRKLVHVSVDAATDTLSSEHDIEVDIDIDGDHTIYANCHVGPGHSSGNTLAISYGYRVATNEINTASYGTLRVAFGDMTGNPLNPSWTVTTVVASQQGPASSGSHRFLESHLVFISGTLWAYWTSAYPSANPIDDLTRLWRSSWNGSAWATPVVWYDPALDATLATAPITAPNVTNFYLLKAFTNGVGIVLNVVGVPNTNPGDPFNFAAYDGPPMVTVSGRRTFASQPISDQKYAAHSRTSRIP